VGWGSCEVNLERRLTGNQVDALLVVARASVRGGGVTHLTGE